MDVAGYGFSEAQRHLERNVAENAELLTRLLVWGMDMSRWEEQTAHT